MSEIGRLRALRWSILGCHDWSILGWPSGHRCHSAQVMLKTRIKASGARTLPTPLGSIEKPKPNPNALYSSSSALLRQILRQLVSGTTLVLKHSLLRHGIELLFENGVLNMVVRG